MVGPLATSTTLAPMLNCSNVASMVRILSACSRPTPFPSEALRAEGAAGSFKRLSGGSAKADAALGAGGAVEEGDGAESEGAASSLLSGSLRRKSWNGLGK